MKSRMGGVARAFLADKIRSSTGVQELPEKEKNRAIQWCTLFRRNWDIFAEFFLGLKLRPYQRAALHEIGSSDVFFWRAGRGGAKSYITALAAICKLLLYPNCWVVVTASTIDQANKIVKNKIEKELAHQSPYLLYLMENGWLKITKPTDGYVVECTLNNSTLTVLAPVESSRGSRSNFTIYDEVAIMKKSNIDEIFEGMLFPRQAAYLSNPKYTGNKRWLEESKSIYLTSSKWKWMWWYNEWKKCVTGYYMDKKTRYNVFASDFFDNIDNGLKTWGDYRRAKKTMDDFTFRMEMLNEAIGEADDAFFAIQPFKDNQVIKKCFRPPSHMDVFVDKDLGNRPKEENEVRLVAVDYAFANTTTKEKNDNTIIICFALLWDEDKRKFHRKLEYIELWPASDSIGACDRARTLWWDYQADYLVGDTRSGGETLYNHLTEPLSIPERGQNWNPSGFTVIDKMAYHIVPETKIADLKERTVDPNAIPCFIPFIGTADTNSVAWVELRKQLENGNIQFLVTMEERKSDIEDDTTFYTMSSEQLAEDLAPYGQTDILIQEAVNLKAEFKNDKVKLVEPRSGTKDRIVILSYVNYISSLIENEWNKQAQQEEINIDDIQLVW